MMLIMFGCLLSCVRGVPVPVVSPVPDLSFTLGGTCCPIGEGPWNIEKGTADANGGFTSSASIGRIWSFDGATDLDGNSATRDWYEYAERVSGAGVWEWMKSGVDRKSVV